MCALYALYQSNKDYLFVLDIFLPLVLLASCILIFRALIGVSSITGAAYVVTLVDDHNQYTWTYLISNKIQVSTVLTHYIQMVSVQFHCEVKKIRTDNGSEFINHKCQELFLSKGIVHQRSCAYTPQQNGITERKHKHLLEVARSIMFQSNFPKDF